MTHYQDAAPDVSAHQDAVTSPSLPVVRRLSLRLGHLYRWACAAGPFDDIWDLCCDHGRLGLHLHQALQQESASAPTRIHLVDRVPKIIAELRQRYSHLIGPGLTILCKDAGEVVLPVHGRQLVIIAGVGGETVANILEKIIGRLKLSELEQQVEFLLSPNLNTFELRRFLRREKFDLVREEFVTEKGWSHEHLHVTYCAARQPDQSVSLVGESLWQPLTKAKEIYLQKQLKHYRNCVRLGGRTDAASAVDAYSSALGA